MKKIILSMTVAMVTVLSSFSQTISIRIVQPERQNLTKESCQALQTIMTEMLTHRRIANNLPSNRFVLTAKADMIKKNFIAGSPARVSERLIITFMVGDVVKNMVFASCTAVITGIGENDEQAIQAAIQTINPGSEKYQTFIKDGEQKIIDYYIAAENVILHRADNLKSERKYDEAIYELCLVPAACGNAFEHCQDKIQEIIRCKYDFEGEQLLTEAKSIWSATLNRDGAQRLLPIIKRISPLASCHVEVLHLLDDIKTKLTADDQRDWAFMVRQYEDELAYQNKQLDAAIYHADKQLEIRRMEIESARDVAIEYAKNQPDVLYQSYVTPVLQW